MINKSFKAYNSKKLKHIHEQIEVACWVWNHCIALQRRYYSLYGGYIDKYRLQNHIAKLRRRNKQWQKLYSQSVQEITHRVDGSYQRFFKKVAKRPPKFKKRREFSSFVFTQSGYKLEENTITFGKRKYKFSKSREYENVKRVVVKRNKLGEIFFVMCCDTEPNKYKRLDNANIGIDFGLKTFLVVSDGTEIKNPQFYKQNLERLKGANRSLSRKRKGSNNRKKALNHLQRGYIDIDNKRSDYQWKLAHKLCKHNQFIAIEDLNIEAMKRLWGRKVSDLAFSEFVLKLEQVAHKYGTVVQKVDRYFPSSKLCTCGVKNTKLKLSDREWVCESCGAVHDRDKFASNNILSEGIRLYRTNSKTKDTILARELVEVAC